MVKNLLANAGAKGDVGLIPGFGRSPGGENGNPLQYSCLENPMDRGSWRDAVHGVAESDTTEATEYAHAHQVLAAAWDLVPWPGIKPRPPALGAQNLATEPPGSHSIEFLKSSLGDSNGHLELKIPGLIYERSFLQQICQLQKDNRLFFETFFSEIL